MLPFNAALERIGGLSNPSKMPCYSYSIPASRCILGSKLRKIKGSTCASCYALKGCYVFPSTIAAMERRMRSVDAMRASPIDRAAWVEAFAEVLHTLEMRTQKLRARTGRPGARDGRVFRWHDSGDLQSVTHLEAIIAVCDATPSVRHWLPTREAWIIKTYLASGQTFPPNLTVRLSAPRVDAAPAQALITLAEHPAIALSGVHSPERGPMGDAQTCIAYTQNGACLDCRACWTPTVNVSYPLH